MTSKNLKQLGRRRFLQALGASTVTSGMVSAREIAGGPEFNPRREVPRVHALKHADHEEFTQQGTPPEREPVIETISRSKWQLVEAADRVRKRVEQKLSDLEPTPEVMVEIPDGADVSSPRGIVVRHVTEVSETDGERVIRSSPGYSSEELTEIVKDRFPDELQARPNTSTHPASPLDHVPRPNDVSPVEGMPIRTEATVVRKNGHGGDHYDREYRPVPAGCAIEPGGGTLGTPAKNYWGYHLFVTAGHLIQYESAAYQNNAVGSEKLGDVYSGNVEVNNDYDAGLITNLDLSATWSIAAQNSSSYRLATIRGTRTKNWLKDGQGEGVQIKKQGTTNPLEYGTIDLWEDTKFESTHEEDNGDSGGPYWHTVNIDEAYICGIHEQAASISNYDAYSQATLMSAIESHFGVWV